MQNAPLCVEHARVQGLGIGLQQLCDVVRDQALHQRSTRLLMRAQAGGQGCSDAAGHGAVPDNGAEQGRQHKWALLWLWAAGWAGARG